MTAPSDTPLLVEHHEGFTRFTNHPTPGYMPPKLSWRERMWRDIEQAKRFCFWWGHRFIKGICERCGATK